MGYLSRHWRGALSLPVAFWVNNVLLSFPLMLGLGLLMAWAAAWGEGLQTLARVVLGAFLLLAVVGVWAPVGAWRSAARWRAEGGSAGWALLAQLVLGLGLLANVVTFVGDVVPELPEMWRLATGRDPIGELDIAVADDGRSLVLSGPIGMGSAARVERALKQAPALRRVVLASPGGRLFEAHEIAGLVRERGLHTRARGDCASACTIVFIAGSQRSLVHPARLGFHRASVPSMNPLHHELANHRLAALYAEAGLPDDFVAGVLRTPAHRMWFPPADVLWAAGVLPPPTLSPALDPALPADAPPARYREALDENLLWAALERRQPGVVDGAAARMHRARLRGQPLDAVAREADATAMAATPAVLRSAGPRSQEAYLQMLAAELRERRAAGEAACDAAFAAGAGAMPERLRGWLQAALVEPDEPQPARPLSPVELEVLRRELGAAAPERIAALLAGTRRGPGCTQAIALVDAMARLRAPQRRLAVRLMLQPVA